MSDSKEPEINFVDLKEQSTEKETAANKLNEN